MNNLKEALNEPEKVLFLDIETTGLSRVYDQVTVIGYDDNKKFNYHIQGDNIKDFENKLKKDEIDLINRSYMIGYYDKEMKRPYKSNYYESELRQKKYI